MKYLLLSIILPLAFGGIISAQTTTKSLLQKERDKQELMRLDDGIGEASNRRDAAALESLIADDFTFTSAAGKTFDKKKTIAYWTKINPNAPDEICASSDMRISVQGKSAVVVALDTCKTEDKDGKPIISQSIFTDFWTKQKGRWQLISEIGAPNIAQQPEKTSQNIVSAEEIERDKQELIRLTNEITHAAVEDDTAPLERLLDNDYLHVNFGNKTSDKATIIKRYTTKGPNETAKSTITASDFQIRFYGDTAVVAYKITDVFRGKNGEQTFHDSQFDVWKRSNKSWRLVASSGAMQLPERKVIRLDAQILDAYAGVYQSADGDSLTVTREGETLLVSISDGTKFDLAPQTEIEFYSPSNSVVSMFFVRSETGAVASAILRYYGADTMMKKIK